MANFSTLKTDIAEVIRTNGNEEITGEVLQYILLEMVTSLGADCQLKGKATPETEPVEPDQNIFYIGGRGQYRNFTGIEVDVPEGSIGIFMWRGSWEARVIEVSRPVDSTLTQGGQNPVEGGAIYTAINNLASAGYLFAGVAVPATTPPSTPTAKIFYLATQGGIYSEFGTGITIPEGINIIRWDGSQWRGDTLWEVEAAPAQGSAKLVKSGGIYTELGKKVDKVEGLGLSQESFTTGEKTKLTDLPTAAQLVELLALKQNVLTFDALPTENSTNPVYSGGVHTAIKDFITRAVDDLINYYTKTETYTKSEVNTLLAAIKQFNILVVQELPEPTIDTMYTIYLVPSAHAVSENIKDEYITLRRVVDDEVQYYWEQIGTTAVDLSDYPTFSQMNAAIVAALADYYTKVEIDAMLAAAIGNLAEIKATADKEVIGVGVATAIGLSVRLDVDTISITIARGGSTVGTGTGRTLNVTDNYTPAASGDVTYDVTCVVGSVTRTTQIVVKAVDAVYYGTGQDASDIVMAASPRLTPAGRYEVTVASAGDHIFVLVPMSMTVSYATLGGLEMPLEAATGVVVGTLAYKCYKSSNSYDAGTYNINVY